MPGGIHTVPPEPAAVVLMEKSVAAKKGLKPLARLVAYGHAGIDPKIMGLGPVSAVKRALARANLKISDLDVIESNEAFAVQVVYCRDRLGLDPEKLNANGGSISIGHPFGMTGSRMVGTIANEMLRRKARYGVVTMCIGGGQGAAGLFEACN